MAKNVRWLPFSISGASSACHMSKIFSTGLSYSIAIFSQKNFFSTHLPKKIFALENFRKFRLKKFSTNEIGGLGVQERAEFSLTKPHHIPLPTTRVLRSYDKLLKKMIFTTTFSFENVT